MFRWFERSQIYHPSRRLDANPSALGWSFEDVQFESGDGTPLHGWFFPARPNSSRRRQVLLLCHGNAGNISHRLLHVAALLETGAAVFIFDYRGYGRSGGSPSEEGTYLDATAAYERLISRGFPPRCIVALGESLGGGVATELATRRPIGGLLLLSAFTSIPELGSELFPWLPVRWLTRTQYDNRAKLPRVDVPVVIVHSRGDSLVPFRHAEANFAAAREPKALVEIEGGHNDLLGSIAVYRPAVKRLLDLAAHPSPPSASAGVIRGSPISGDHPSGPLPAPLRSTPPHPRPLA